MRALAIMTCAALLLTVPAWAQERTVADLSHDPASRFDLERGFEALNHLLAQVDSYVNDHLEVEGQYRPESPEGASLGRLRLRLYPQGRARSQETIEAETSIEAGTGRFSFQFRIQEAEPPAFDAERYF